MFCRQNYRIYPTKEQETILNGWLGCTRWIWNHMLEKNIKRYEDEQKFYFTFDMNNMLPDLKKCEEYKWLSECPSQALQQKCQDLSTALKSTGKTQKNRKGFPKFKSKKTDESGFRVLSFKIIENKLFLPKLKIGIKIKLHRQLLGDAGMITIIKDSVGNWFCSITVDIGEYKEPQKVSNIKNAVGLDLGIKEFCVTSDGEFIKNPKWIKQYEKKLKRHQRKHSKKQKGSKNREKARIRLAKIHKKIANKRKDFINQNASLIAKVNDLIAIENLNVSDMLKNHKLAKSVSDVSFYQFRLALEWQCKKRGKHLVVIDRWYPSSKTCSNCGGIKQDLTLGDRTFTCPHCQFEMDRDINASINILNEGLRKISEV